MRTNKKYALLPVSCTQREQIRSYLPGEVSPPFHQHLITIIDDSPTVRKILEVCLGRADYHVLSFPDGVAFLRWLMTPDSCIPALVLIDLNLPKMDGYTLIRHLKAKPAFAWTVFVILTGRDGMLDRLKGRLSGANAYLTKPFRTDDILTTVHTCLGPLPIPQIAERQKEGVYQ